MRMFALVETPHDRPPRGATLVRTANLLPFGIAEEGAGIRYWPDACGDAGARAARICGGNFVGWPDPAERPPVVDYVPPFVAAAEACSVITGEEAFTIATERARRTLDNCGTIGMARELWRGDVARAEIDAGDVDFPNDYLTKAETLTELAAGDAVPVRDAFAWLEQGLATCSCGGIGVIHAAPFTATLWASLDLITATPDGRLVSKLGTLVIADPGYDGSGPTDPDADPDPLPPTAPPDTWATAWAYATTMVDVRRGAVSIVGDRSTMDRETNDFTVYAAQPFAATFDPCCHLGVQVDHTDRS